MASRNLNRRTFLTAAGATCSIGMLGGCSAIFDKVGESSHAGRRTAQPPVQPLVFSQGEGMRALNATRAQFGLQPFTSDARLQNAAQTHADLMGRTGQYGHEFGPATKFPRRLAKVGFDGSAGENLGVGYGSIEDAIEGWLDSPKHRKILLRANYNSAGIAYSFNRSGKNPRYTHYWVLIVGRPGGHGQFLRRV